LFLSPDGDPLIHVELLGKSDEIGNLLLRDFSCLIEFHALLVSEHFDEFVKELVPDLRFGRLRFVGGDFVFSCGD
jgi:hypothetical protein